MQNGTHTIAVNHSVHNPNHPAGYLRHSGQPPPPPLSPPPNVVPVNTARLVDEYERHAYGPPTSYRPTYR